MAFLSSESLLNILPRSIKPFNRKRLKDASYELSLGGEYFVTGEQGNVVEKIDEEQQIVIAPGQLAILLTEETIEIPVNMLALISIKAGIKFKGLVNISGFHVDPGFHGKLIFSVYNAGPKEIVLQRGDPYFLIWFCHLDGGNTPAYSGARQGQNKISSDMVMNLKGEVVSPIILHNKILDLQKDAAFNRWLFGALVLLLLGIGFKSCIESKPVTDTNNANIQIKQNAASNNSNNSVLSSNRELINSNQPSQNSIKVIGANNAVKTR